MIKKERERGNTAYQLFFAEELSALEVFVIWKRGGQVRREEDNMAQTSSET